MPPKYKKKSAFYYFLEYVKTAKRYKSLAYAQDEADKRWKLMTPEERLPYQEKAKRDANPNLNLENDMIRLEREEKEATLKNQNDMKHLINKLVQSNTLTSEYFHILHFNTFCYCDSNQKHYPAEVAMVRFNLNEGIEDGNMFSSIIQPGRIPIGYTLTVRQKSGETHQIPEPTIDSECNLKFIISKLYEIMAANQNSTTKEYPPIFVRDCDKTETNQILNQLCADYSIDRQAFRIYSLQYFFFVLRNAHREVWPSLSQSITEIEKDSYDCIPNLSCPYHKDTSAFIYCSECIVTRMVYIICDNCCAPWNITMKPGRHIPFNSLCVKPADVRRDEEFLERRINQLSVAAPETESSDSDDIVDLRNNLSSPRRENVTYSQMAVAGRPSTSGSFAPLRRPTTTSLSVSGMYNFLGSGRGRGIIRK